MVPVGLNAAPAGAAVATANWIPSDAVFVVEIRQPAKLLEQLLDEKALSSIAALHGYRKRAATPEFGRFLKTVEFLETQLATDWRTGLAKLTGGGLVWAFCPKNRSVLIADADDERLLRQLHTIILRTTFLRAKIAGQAAEPASEQIAGIRTWNLSPGEAHAILGNRLIAAAGVEGIRSALELREKPEPSGLAATAGYQAARLAVGSDAVGMVYVNLDILKLSPALVRALMPAKPNPLAALLFAGMADGIGRSKWLAMGLHVQDGGLALHLVPDGAGTVSGNPAAFAFPDKPDKGVLPNLTVPRRIAVLSLYRDLRLFYQAKDQLFPERTSELIFFENMMGIFFSGRELTDDVLAQFKPQIRLVAATQEYDPAIGIPEEQIPAFAAILQMSDPENFAEVVEEAWQKAIGLSNFTRGQQALPGVIIDRPVHSGIPFSAARFSSLGIKDRSKIDSRFNYQPSLAMVGDYVILSSTEGLARDLIDSVLRVTKDPARPLAPAHSLLEFDGKMLAAALEANRGTLAREEMLKEGAGAMTDSTSVDGWIDLANLLDSLRLKIGTQAAVNEAWLELNFAWSRPGSSSGSGKRALAATAPALQRIEP